MSKESDRRYRCLIHGTRWADCCGAEPVARTSKDGVLPPQSVDLIRATLEDTRKHGLIGGLPQEHAFTLLAEIDRLNRMIAWLDPPDGLSDETNEQPSEHNAEVVRLLTLFHEVTDLTCEEHDCVPCRRIDEVAERALRGELKALPPQCSCDPNPSIGGSPPCPVHDGESEEV